jgi:hypothetical protein
VWDFDGNFAGLVGHNRWGQQWDVWKGDYIVKDCVEGRDYYYMVPSKQFEEKFALDTAPENDDSMSYGPWKYSVRDCAEWALDKINCKTTLCLGEWIKEKNQKK